MTNTQPIGIPVSDYVWTDDYSFMRTLTCRNHPTARYSTKNPFARSIHLIKIPDGMVTECDCPFGDLIVIHPLPGVSL